MPCDLRDVRVIEAGEDLRLPLEPGEAIRVIGKGDGEDLQRDLAVKLGVGGLPDLVHTPLAEQSGHVVMAETGADCERHRLSGPCSRHCTLTRAVDHALLERASHEVTHRAPHFQPAGAAGAAVKKTRS